MITAVLGTSIETGELTDGAVTTSKLADGSVTAAKIVDGDVVTAKLGDGSVTTVKIVDSAITFAKIQDLAANSLLGNPNGSAAAGTNIGIGSGLGFSAGDLYNSGLLTLSVNGPLQTTGGQSPTLSIAQANGTTDGYLSAADFATFNAKQAALTLGNLSSSTSGITVTGGTGAVVGGGVSITIATASGAQNGLLSSIDWTTFSAKENALTFSGNGLLVRSGDAVSVQPVPLIRF